MKLAINSFITADRLSKSIVFIILSVFLSACQLLEQSDSNVLFVSNTVNYNQYYLGLKKLSDSELLVEIQQQKLKKSQGSIEAEINLILLHSLPNSPIHNVYTAKSQLNLQAIDHKNYQFSPEDRAFITLLKDQLNQQLYLFQKMIKQELAYDKQIAEYQIEQLKQQEAISALESKVAQLTEQITQLKKIEKAISGHGQ